MTSFDDLLSKKKPVAVVGLGYVGLPLAVALSRHFSVIGFDISPRITSYNVCYTKLLRLGAASMGRG